MNNWQDITLMIVGIVFTVSLVPQVIEGFKKKSGSISLWTSIPTTLGLVVICYTYTTLHLYFSAGMTGFTGFLWLILWIQRIQYKN